MQSYIGTGACSAMGTGARAPPKNLNLGNCNCNVCKYALKFKKGCKQIAENWGGGGLPSAPVHPPSWGAEHAPGITKDYLQKSREWCKQVYCAYKIENLNWQPGELLYPER